MREEGGRGAGPKREEVEGNAETGGRGFSGVSASEGVGIDSERCFFRFKPLASWARAMSFFFVFSERVSFFMSRRVG